MSLMTAALISTWRRTMSCSAGLSDVALHSRSADTPILPMS